MGIDQNQIKQDVTNLNQVALKGDQNALQQSIGSMPFEERQAALVAWSKDIEQRQASNPNLDIPKLELTYGTDSEGHKNAITKAEIKERPGIANLGGLTAETVTVFENKDKSNQQQNTEKGPSDFWPLILGSKTKFET